MALTFAPKTNCNGENSTHIDHFVQQLKAPRTGSHVCAAMSSIRPGFSPERVPHRPKSEYD